jgi:hypothetical protein
MAGYGLWILSTLAEALTPGIAGRSVRMDVKFPKSAPQE